MARPFRIEYPGALYPLTSRGDRQEKIYLDDADREEFLSVLGSVGERSGWRLYAYCLMDNHYHLMVETPKGKLRSPNPGQKRRAPIRDSKNSPCRTTNSELNRP